LNSIDLNEVRLAADYIKNNLAGHFVSYEPFRFCLEIFHRVLFKQLNIISPSIEIGIGDGFSSWFMHRGKEDIDYGSDMPFGSTLESCGMDVDIQFDHYTHMIGMDMTDIAFADNSFASIFSSHTMAYGQDLNRSFEELFRVLAPGGTCAFFIDTSEQWHQFKPLMNFLMAPNLVPSLTFYPKDFYLELLSKLGAINMTCRPFYQAALEAVNLGTSYIMSATGGHPILSSAIVQNPTVINLSDMMREIFMTLIENELKRPEGPDDAFNIFVTFQKPGNLPQNLSIPEPVCLNCRNQDLIRELTKLNCNSCGSTFSVRAGIPNMIKPNHSGYSSTPVHQHAEQVSNTLDLLIHNFVDNLQDRRLYVVNDGRSPLGGSSSSILLASLNYLNREVAGIYDTSVPVGKNWRGSSIVHANEINNAPGTLLAFLSEAEYPTVKRRLQESGIHGAVKVFVWSLSQGQIKGQITSIML